MSALSMFLKKNKVVKENTFYAATTSLMDDKGQPLEWEIKPLSTKQDEAIRDSCTREVPIPGKANMYRQKIDTNAYIAKQLVASVESPNLYDKDLQDSYGVMTPEELVKEMVDDPGEYQEFAKFVQQFNGYDVTINDKVDEAKN